MEDTNKRDEKLDRLHTNLPPEVYETVFNATKEGIFIHDARSGRVIDINNAALKMFACRRSDMIGSSPNDFSLGNPPYSDAEAKMWIERARTHGPQRFQWLSKRKDGILFWTEISLTVTRIAGEERVIAVVRDISERKKLEEILAYSEARYRSLFEHINAGVAVYKAVDGGRDFIFMDFNRTAEQFEKIGREKVIGKSVLEVFPGVKEFGLFEVFQRVWRTGKPEHHPISHYKDGRIEGWRDNYVFKLPSGEIVAVYQDVTRQKQAEEALKKSEATLKGLLRAAPTAIFLLQDRIFKWVSPRMTDLTGYGEEELLGQSTKMLYLSEADFEQTGKAYDQAKYGLVGEIEAIWKRKDGRLINVLLRGSPLNPQDHSEGYIITALDISDRKRAEKEKIDLERQIQHVQKLESLGVLAGGIAHDFNNLLMGILGNADLALLELPLTSPARQHIAAIEEASRRAAELCRQMLAYSGKGRFVIQKLDLSELVREMIQMLQVSISKKAVLKFNLAENLPPVEADATQLRQVIMNLVINASEAIGSKSGVISITTGAMECDRKYLTETYVDEGLPEGLYVYMEVADTGCGMDEDTKARIFDPFFTTKFTGRGLGMAAVLGIVRGHGGSIKVYSEPGRGSTIKVLFPAAEGLPDEIEHQNDSTGEWRGSGTVLLVDDEDTVLAVGKQMLEHIGFSVITVKDGLEALKVFKQKSKEIQCIILDLTMPRMDGEQAFRELRRINPDTPVIMSSGYNEQEVTQRFSGKKLTGFIQKPYNLNELKEILQKALKK